MPVLIGLMWAMIIGFNDGQWVETRRSREKSAAEAGADAGGAAGGDDPVELRPSEPSTGDSETMKGHERALKEYPQPLDDWKLITVLAVPLLLLKVAIVYAVCACCTNQSDNEQAVSEFLEAERGATGHHGGRNSWTWGERLPQAGVRMKLMKYWIFTGGGRNGGGGRTSFWIRIERVQDGGLREPGGNARRVDIEMQAPAAAGANKD